MVSSLCHSVMTRIQLHVLTAANDVVAFSTDWKNLGFGIFSSVHISYDSSVKTILDVMTERERCQGSEDGRVAYLELKKRDTVLRRVLGKTG